jgi:hypothetical protein
MAASFEMRQWITAAAGVVVITVLGIRFPPLLIVFGIAGVVLAVRPRGAGRGLLLLGVVWLLLGVVLSLGLGASSTTGQKNDTGALTR